MAHTACVDVAAGIDTGPAVGTSRVRHKSDFAGTRAGTAAHTSGFEPVRSHNCEFGLGADRKCGSASKSLSRLGAQRQGQHR
jgi:hypothetical protein